MNLAKLEKTANYIMKYFLKYKEDIFIELKNYEKTIIDSLELVYSIKKYEKFELNNDALCFNKINLKSKHFKNIKNACELHLILISIKNKNKNEKDETMLEAYFENLILLSYLDSSRIFLEKELINKKKYLSDFFASGFYDIDFDINKALIKEFPYKKMSVSLNNSKVLEPAQTLMGFYIGANEKIENTNACDYCLNKFDCDFCSYKLRKTILEGDLLDEKKGF